MYFLRLFGGASLEGPFGPLSGTVVQQRPLALLALLAVAHRTGCTREKLVGYLWPEVEDERARRRLADVLYQIRKGLGDDSVEASGETLFLNPRVVETDVATFLTALEVRDFETAVATFAGPFLDGFPAGRAREFERWIDAQRQRLGDEYSRALQSLASRSKAIGDYVAVARRCRQLLAHDPYNSRFALDLIEALARSGDPANARLALREHERRLLDELETEPPPDFHDLAEQLIASRATSKVPNAGLDQTAGVPAVERGIPPAPVAASARARRASRLRTGLLVAVVALVVLGARSLLIRKGLGAAPGTSVAVLPFENRSPNPDDAYLADAIHDEIIGQLSKIGALRVISRTSVMEYRGRTDNVHTIARELDVTHLMEGSLQRVDDQVRVMVQLVDAMRDAPVWGESYERRMSDIFAIQTDIARDVATALRARLTREETGRIEREPTANSEAYDFFLRGNGYLNRGFDEEFVRLAVRMYNNAVALDSGFALAWARLGKANTWMYFLYYDHAPLRLASAEAAVERARQLDPDSPDVHLCLAWYHYQGLLNYERALQELETVQAIQPNTSEAWALTHYIRRRQGQFAEAASAMKTALELDPRNGLLHDQLTQTYRLMRDYPAALFHVEQALLLEPSSATGYLDAIRLYLKWQGSTTDARRYIEQARRVGVADNQFLRHAAVMVELFDGRPQAALKLLGFDETESYSVYPYFVPKAQLAAQAYRLLGDLEMERRSYERARLVAERRIAEVPGDDRLYSALGVALAGLGRRDEAISAGREAVDLMPIQAEAWRGAVRREDLARIYTMVGDHETAIEELEYLMSIPSTLSVALLQLDPVWGPLRDDPQLKRLLQRYAN